MTSAAITISRDASTAVFENYAGTVVATIVRTDAYHVRLYAGPDEFTASAWMRHALMLA